MLGGWCWWAVVGLREQTVHVPCPALPIQPPVHLCPCPHTHLQLPEGDAKELLAYQLSAAARSKEATRAPWFRDQAGGTKPAAPVSGAGLGESCC